MFVNTGAVINSTILALGVVPSYVHLVSSNLRIATAKIKKHAAHKILHI
jgi:hypothetical protein